MRDIASWVESAASRLAAADLVIEITAADLMRLLRDGPWAWEAVEHRLVKITHTLNEHRADIDVHRVALDQMHANGMSGIGEDLHWRETVQPEPSRQPRPPRHSRQPESQDGPCPMNPKQLQTVQLLADGRTIEEIANIMGASHQTTRSRVRYAKRYANATSGQSTELVAIAIRNGWID